MTFDDFAARIESARAETDGPLVMPVHRRRSADLLTPVSAFLALRAQADFPFLLESVEGGEKLARYSFIGGNPYRVVRATEHGATVSITTRRDADGLGTPDDSGTIFDVLTRLTEPFTELASPELPRLRGGAVGYMGYDTVRLIEHLPDAPPDTLHLPDAVWGFYDTLAAFDHVRHQLVVMASAFVSPDTDLRTAYDDAMQRLDQLEAQLNAPAEHPEPLELPSPDIESNFERDVFEQAVRDAKQHIVDGDIFQVVLSQRFESDFRGDRFNLYRALRQVNPSPYLFYLDFDDVALVGSSPEVLVRVEDGRAEVLPIAGTRPRGDTEAEDQALAEELAADPKERAEHLMLVDLGRNDLGRVCDYQSINVDRYAFIERYSHVMHIVSSVSGAVRGERTPMEVLAACFPAGTVSGAPKVRAMELIDTFEPTRRGVYAGAVGYLDFSGTLDTCIAIRTMVVRGDTVYVQAGAGIVADSDPAAEYEETRNKAAALHEALQVATDDLL